MSQEDLDKSESATPYKLQEARKRGSIGKSADAVAALVFAAAVAYVYSRGWSDVQAQFRFDQALFLQAAAGLSQVQLWQMIHDAVLGTVSLLTPFLISLMLAASFGNAIQNTPTFTLKPLQPDWQRINPVRGLKRLFSIRTVYDAARAWLKLGLLAAVIYFAISDLAHQYHELSNQSAGSFLRRFLDDLAAMGFRVALMLGLLALLDLAYSRHEFAQQMRMSRRELRDEVKRREGDPRIRSRLRQLRLEMLKRSLSIRKTGDGDVLITNPTHLAVALRYRHGEMAAPQLVAKGAGALAADMRAIAARRGIPVVQNRTLARQLYKQVDFGAAVPADLYAPVARILVWVIAMRDARSAGMTAGMNAGRAGGAAKAGA